MGHTSLLSLPGIGLRRISASLFAKIAAVTGCGVVLALTIGCGSNTSGPAPSKTPLAIVSQPQNASVPLGQTATFSVQASGEGTLSYQWSRNGVAISGANSASYTTPSTQLSDNSSQYTVQVTDADSSLTSTPGTLTIGPRAPKSGDLRFQQVDSADVALEGTGGIESTNIIIDGSHSSDTFSAASGTPLFLAPANYNCDTLQTTPDCSWELGTTALPTGAPVISMFYTCDQLESMTSDLASLPPSISVVTSLDMPPGVDAYAMAVTEGSQNTGFDLKQEVVSAAAVDATVNADGLQSRVITAVSFDSTGMAHLFSYGWQGDTTILYDTATQIVAPAQVASAATTLAGQGYIITAFGGNDANGYVLVGAKVQGDTLPRPLIIETESSSTSPGSLNGYAPVALVQYPSAAAPQGASNHTFVFEH